MFFICKLVKSTNKLSGNELFIRCTKISKLRLKLSNSLYLEVAQIWYMQLKMLGYTNHKLVCLDEETYNTLALQRDFADGIIYSSGARGEDQFLTRKV